MTDALSVIGMGVREYGIPLLDRRVRGRCIHNVRDVPSGKVIRLHEPRLYIPLLRNALSVSQRLGSDVHGAWSEQFVLVMSVYLEKS